MVSIRKILLFLKQRGDIVNRITDIYKHLKEMIAGQSKKKLIENTAIVIIIGIIVIIAGGTIFSNKNSSASQEEQQKTPGAINGSQLSASAPDDTEAKLSSLLSQIQGVGKVDVMITYSATQENVPAYDTKKNQSSTDEKDSEGGTRTISQEELDNTMVYEDGADGGKVPVILKKLEPEVKGVLVVAEGANSVEVRERLCNAVRVVLDIPIHRIEIVQRKK